MNDETEPLKTLAIVNDEGIVEIEILIDDSSVVTYIQQTELIQLCSQSILKTVKKHSEGIGMEVITVEFILSCLEETIAYNIRELYEKIKPKPNNVVSFASHKSKK
jgi:hypothetical protein